MGIYKGTFSLLCEFKKDIKSFSGNFLQLGKQDIYLNRRLFNKVLKKFKLTNNNKNYKVTNEELFKTLGFKNIESLDYSDFEGSTITHDLNKDIPKKYHDKFDVIYNGGTCEHVFNFPKTLESIHKMLKVNGLVIHEVPTNNFVDHGFYMISPTNLMDYYKANNYEIVKSYIVERDKRFLNLFPWKVYKYDQQGFSQLASGGHGKKNIVMVSIFVVRKLKFSTYEVIPTQSYYQNAYEQLPIKKSNNLKEKIKSKISKNPALEDILLILKRAIKLKLQDIFGYKIKVYKKY